MKIRLKSLSFKRKREEGWSRFCFKIDWLGQFRWPRLVNQSPKLNGQNWSISAPESPSERRSLKMKPRRFSLSSLNKSKDQRLDFNPKIRPHFLSPLRGGWRLPLQFNTFFLLSTTAPPPIENHLRRPVMANPPRISTKLLLSLSSIPIC